MFTFNKGRRALITGGASGFGFAIAQRLVEMESSVVLVDINTAALEQALAKLGSRAAALTFDVTDRAAVMRGTAQAAEILNGIDTLVTSAGVFTFGEISEITEASWDLTININLKGTFLVAQAALPYLRNNQHAWVVTISSTSGVRGDDCASHYSASKWGVIGLTQSMAIENGRYGINCNTVCPGTVPDTTMGGLSMQQKIAMRNMSAQDIIGRDGAALPLGRLGNPQDIADAVMFLISDNAAWITGQTLVVDGGALLAPRIKIDKQGLK